MRPVYERSVGYQSASSRLAGACGILATTDRVLETAVHGSFKVCLIIKEISRRCARHNLQHLLHAERGTLEHLKDGR